MNKATATIAGYADGAFVQACLASSRPQYGLWYNLGARVRYEDYLDGAAARWPQGTALICEDQVLSFTELNHRVKTLGAQLRGLGLKSGDRVGDLRENSVESVVTDFGCALAGCPRVALNPRLSDTEIREMLIDSAPEVLLTGGGQEKRALEAGLGDLVGKILADDELASMSAAKPAGDLAAPPSPVLALRYTGGTTGRAKGVLRTHDQQSWVAANFLMDLLDLEETDVFVHSQPLSQGTHSFVLPCVMRGTAQVILPRLRATAALDAVETHRATVLKCVPTMLHRILDALEEGAWGLGSLRQIVFGAAPMPKNVLQRALARFGPILCQTYGQAEAPATVTRLTRNELARALTDRPQLLSSVGRAYSTADVRIVDEKFQEAAVGEVGEIVVRAPMNTEGYYHGAAAAAGEVPASPVDEHGFVHTGDLGRRDEEGFVFLEGRARDLIISGGYNVYPGQVEDALRDHPAVRDAVALGLEDDEWGEVVVAAVVQEMPVEPQSLIEHCGERLAPYKVPREIRFIDEIPLSAAGKPLRRGLIATFRTA